MTTAREEFWHFMIDGRQDDQTGVLSNFFVYGPHCGAALQQALQAADDQGVAGAYAVEASRLDNLEDYELPDDAFELPSGVLMLPTRYTYPLGVDAPEFVPPTGIIKAGDGDEEQEEHDYALIRETFVAYAADDEGFFHFELVVEQPRLNATFLQAIRSLPAISGFWLQLQEHWHDGPTELWVNQQLTSPAAIEDFLRTYRTSTLENGFVDCIVSAEIGDTSLTLDEHKTIRLRTQDEDVFVAFLRGIEQLGFERTTGELYSLEVGYHHYHYRPHDSLSRPDFTALLASQGFELFDSWEEDE